MSEAKRIPSETGAVGATRQLAQFASSLRFEQLPRDVVSKTKLSILDTLGCCIFGASLPPMKKLATMAAAEGCARSSAAFGMPLRTSAALAALVNGASALAFQLAEIHLESTLHPAPLAASRLCDSRRPTDRYAQPITAIVAADEVGIRLVCGQRWNVQDRFTINTRRLLLPLLPPGTLSLMPIKRSTP